MTDEEQASPEDAPEVVQSEAEQVEASEATESTEGQTEEGQPAEEEPVKEPEESEEEVSASKARRERRKAAAKALKDELDAAKAEKAKLEQYVSELEASGATPPPKQEDFADYDDYLAAKNAHYSMQAFDKRESEKIKRQAAEKQERLQQLEAQSEAEARDNWAAQRAEASKRYADFDAVVSAPDVAITESMARIIAMSDSGADIAYHLGTNKDLARQIAGMGPEQQAGAISMLEQYVPKTMPKPRTKTAAPDPITPVKAQATLTKDPDKMTASEYRAWREAGGSF